MGLTGPVQANDIVMRASEIGTTIPGIASLAMKSARKGAQRGVQGIYQLPSGNEPTPEFMNVSQQNLNNQTRQMTNMLNMMAPEDEQLAYINEQEAGILKLLGGSGEMTPQGIPTYRGHHGGGGGGSSSNGSGNGNGNGNDGGGGGGGGQDAGAGSEDQGEGAGVSSGVSDAMGEKDSDKDKEGAGGNMPQGFVEAEGEAEATAAAVEAAAKEAEAAKNNYGRPNMGDITGGYNTPSGDTPSTNNPDLGPEGKKTYDAIEDAKQALKDTVVTNVNPYTNVKTTVKNINPYTGEVTDVVAGGLREKAEKNLADLMTRIDFVDSMKQAEETADLAEKGISRDKAYAMTGLDTSIGLQDLTGGYGQTSLSGMEGRLDELTAKAKANTLEGDELNELAQLNEFFGKNPTTGMGFLESLDYQFNNPQFKEDLAKAAPFLGAAALTAFAPGVVKTIMGINNLMKTFDIKPSASLRTTIENQLKKLTGKERKALASTLPSTYKGFGIQGENRGGGGEDRAAAKREAERRAREEEERRAREEEENNRKRDRFERSFANRYFTGPASLDEVRRYATEGGYSQLTPFYGQENETV